MERTDEERIMKEAEDIPCFQLWGEDTFSGESYFCDVYMHRSSANRARRRLEAKARERASEGLVDSYWVMPMTLAEHYRWVHNENAYKEKTWMEIDRHKAYINEVMPKFTDFFKKSLEKPGTYTYVTPQTDEPCHITSLAVEFHKQYRSRSEYELNVTIKFDNEWTAARLTSSSLWIKSGTMEEIQKLEITEQHLRSLKGFFQKAIEKYFYGD